MASYIAFLQDNDVTDERGNERAFTIFINDQLSAIGDTHSNNFLSLWKKVDPWTTDGGSHEYEIWFGSYSMGPVR